MCAGVPFKTKEEIAAEIAEGLYVMHAMMTNHTDGTCIGPSGEALDVEILPRNIARDPTTKKLYVVDREQQDATFAWNDGLIDYPSKEKLRALREREPDAARY